MQHTFYHRLAMVRGVVGLTTELVGWNEVGSKTACAYPNTAKALEAMALHEELISNYYNAVMGAQTNAAN